MHSFEPWIPEEWDSSVIQRVNENSVLERIGRPVKMTTRTKHVPRSGGMGLDVLDRGDSYSEDDSTDDEVLLTARKFGRALSLAEEDIADSEGLIDAIDVKKSDWARAFAVGLDNSAFAVSGAESMGSNRPFTSVYQSVRTTDSGLGYTADASYVSAGDNLGAVTFTDTGDIVTYLQAHGLKVNDRVKFGAITSTTGLTAGTTYYVRTVPSTTTVTLSATSGGSTLALTTDGSSVSATKLAVTYASLSRVVGTHEQSDWYDPSKAIVVAAPYFKQACRDIVDLNGRPILVDGGGNQGDTLFGYKVEWSMGARVSTSTTPAPTGNPLLIVTNRDLLILGRRSGPESYIAGPNTGAGWSTDETKLKVRARRAFALGHPAGASVYEAV